MTAGVQSRSPSAETRKDGVAESCEPTATMVSPDALTWLNAVAFKEFAAWLSFTAGIATLRWLVAGVAWAPCLASVGLARPMNIIAATVPTPAMTMAGTPRRTNVIGATRRLRFRRLTGLDGSSGE